MEMLALLAVLVAIALAAPRYGADSRFPPPGEFPAPRYHHTVSGDVAALTHRARRALRAR